MARTKQIKQVTEKGQPLAVFGKKKKAKSNVKALPGKTGPQQNNIKSPGNFFHILKYLKNLNELTKF